MITSSFRLNTLVPFLVTLLKGLLEVELSYSNMLGEELQMHKTENEALNAGCSGCGVCNQISCDGDAAGQDRERRHKVAAFSIAMFFAQLSGQVK